MAKPRPESTLTLVNFLCRSCRRSFAAAPGRVDDAPDRSHPWRYFAECPECGAEAEQAPWEMGLMASYGRHTGPRTAEGLAVTAANLDGHPTPEEAKRTRFNAMKHGLNARVAAYFPAKPGKYPHCDGCEHLATFHCMDFGACLKRTELFMRFHAAFEMEDPGVLREIMADTQAGVAALINDMMLAITQDGGPRLKSPEWYYDKEGGFHLAAYADAATGAQVQLYKLEAHPLLKFLMDYISKNSSTLADLNMTPKAQEDRDLIQGHLDDQAADRDSVLEYQRRQAVALEDLRGLIDNSYHQARRDPVLIEHHGESDG